MKIFRLVIRKKKRAAAAALAVLMASCVLAALACQNPIAPSSTPPASGAAASLSVSFSIPPSRSVAASPGNLAAAISTLAIAVVDGSNATVASASGIGYGAGVVKTFGSIVPGTYTIVVNAYSAAGALIAAGLRAVTVAANIDQTVTVNLAFSQSASTGGFSLALSWPVSTGLAYVYATVDGAAIAVPTVTADATNYSATLAASNLAGGARLLRIYFKTSAGAAVSVGPFVEAVNIWDGVTSACWIDSGGNAVTQRQFAAGEFSSPDASLAGLTIAGASLTASFAGATTNYGLTDLSGSSFTFTATCVSGAQDISYTWNGVPQSWGSAGSLAFTSTSLSYAVGVNTLQITVTAPDRQTTRIYTINPPTFLTSGNFSSALAADRYGSFLLTSDVTVASPCPDFYGTLDGNGHTVTLAISTASYAGLFSMLQSGGTVKNLTLTGNIAGGGYVGSVAGANRGTIQNCTSSTTVSSSGERVGGIAGYNEGTIEDCSSTGNVTSTYTGGPVGGIVGANWGGTLRHCWSSGTITGCMFVGGLVGRNLASITECYSVATVVGSVNFYYGGFVGGSSGTITNCYARGNVSGPVWPAGFTGFTNSGSISCCYATGTATGTYSGEFVGSDSGGSYSYNYTVSAGQPGTAGALASGSLPAGFDSAVWLVDATGVFNGGYPYLQYFGAGTVTP